MGRVLLTVGHSQSALEDFLGVLRGHGVQRVADVRRFPASRRHPQFALEALRDALRDAGVQYSWYPQLGGRRTRAADAPPSRWRVEAFAAYADHMRTAEFQVAMRRLLQEAEGATTAVMCAEALPGVCHRRLISDCAELHGMAVEHIVAGRPDRERHQLSPGVRLGRGGIVYDEESRGQLSLEPQL